MLGNVICKLRKDYRVVCVLVALMLAANVLATAERTSGLEEVSTLGSAEIQQIEVGNGFACALKQDSTVWCWGRNDLGQLGAGTTTDQSTPSRVQGLPRVAKLSAGDSHVCAISTKNKAWCWGWNRFSQLGDGSRMLRLSPVKVKSKVKFADIAAGSYHTCAVDNAQKVWCWGNNGNHLGFKASRGQSTSQPKMVKRIAGVRSVSAGLNGTCAALLAGVVKCWGPEEILGDGKSLGFRDLSILPFEDGWVPKRSSRIPILIADVVNASFVQVGIFWACSLLSDSGVRCWGHPDEALSDSEVSSYFTLPTRIEGITSAKALSIGAYSGCVIDLVNMVVCWGDNWDGIVNPLGRWTDAGSANQVQLSGMATAIDVGSRNACAVLGGAEVWCWGSRDDGFFGEPAEDAFSAPRQIVFP
jgi:alpha-tubulin suppressor-like RCC1 family protein